jgi:hypothetical protein
VSTIRALEDLGEGDEGVAVHVEKVAPLGERNCAPRQ